jgi:hypothetical protein
VHARPGRSAVRGGGIGPDRPAWSRRRSLRAMEGSHRCGVPGEAFVEHELVQALHGAACASLELDRYDAATGLDQEVDLARSSTFALALARGLQARRTGDLGARGPLGTTAATGGQAVLTSRTRRARPVGPPRRPSSNVRVGLVCNAVGNRPRLRLLRCSSSSPSRAENLRTVVGPVRRCGQARSSLAWCHMRGCPRLRKTTAPRSAFWPIAHVVILGRQRPQAATLEHGARALNLRSCSTRAFYVQCQRRAWSTRSGAKHYLHISSVSANQHVRPEQVAPRRRRFHRAPSEGPGKIAVDGGTSQNHSAVGESSTRNSFWDRN